MPTIRQMYGGTYNLYKTIYQNGKIFRQTANTPKISNANYNTTKTNFNVNFDEKISSLKKSSAEIKNLDFSEKNSVETVKNFLNNYNDAIKFFEENSSLSNKIGNLSKNFSSTAYFSKIYSEVGISTNSDGTMNLDDEKFSSAVEKNSGKVSRIFDSLASKADANVMTANLRKNSLFPSAKNIFGLYGKNNLFNSYSNIGNFLNFMF